MNLFCPQGGYAWIIKFWNHVSSMERFVKKISLSTGREKEDSYETPLNYNMEDAEPAERVKKSGDVYTQEEAQQEAAGA